MIPVSDLNRHHQLWLSEDVVNKKWSEQRPQTATTNKNENFCQLEGEVRFSCFGDNSPLEINEEKINKILAIYRDKCE